MVNEPFEFPQVELTGVNANAVGPAIFPIVVLEVNVQPFISRTITVYVFGAKPVKFVVALNPAGPGVTE